MPSPKKTLGALGKTSIPPKSGEGVDPRLLAHATYTASERTPEAELALRSDMLAWRRRRLMNRLQRLAADDAAETLASPPLATPATLDRDVAVYREQVAVRSRALVHAARLTLAVEGKQPLPSLSQGTEGHGLRAPSAHALAALEAMRANTEILRVRGLPRDKAPDWIRNTWWGGPIMRFGPLERLIVKLYNLASYDARAVAAQTASQCELMLSVLDEILPQRRR